MTTRIDPGGPSTGVAGTATAPRVTPPPARPFRQVLDAGTQAIVRSAESAVRTLPGGPILAASLRPPSPAVGRGGAGSAEGPTGTGPGSGGAASVGAVGSGEGVEGALARSAEMSLYYLELQERVAAENRSYTALSNVLKAQHDTVKNAISNIR